MTQEEKAKAYDEAVERIAMLLGKNGAVIGRYWLEKIFSQLTESEDERIRKWLIAEIKATHDYDSPTSAKCVDDAIAWLEKQKEQKPDIELIQRSWYLEGYHDREFGKEPIWIIKTGEGGPEYVENPKYGQMLKEQQPAESISQLTVQGKGVYKICPRCKERMVRDDSKVYTSMPPQYGYNCPKCGTMEFDTVMYDSPEMKEQVLPGFEDGPKVIPGKDFIPVAWVDACERYGKWKIIEQKPAEWSDSVAKEMFIKALERAVEQTKKGYELTDCDKHSWWEDFKAYSGIKPAEWSEEDEKIVGTIISDGSRGVELDSKQVAWLKSLRPQPHWKPSEEQVSILGKVFAGCELNTTERDSMVDLFYHLKDMI